MDDDVQLELAIELSKKQAEEDARKQKQKQNGNNLLLDSTPKTHTLESDPKQMGELLQMGFKYEILAHLYITFA